MFFNKFIVSLVVTGITSAAAGFGIGRKTAKPRLTKEQSENLKVASKLIEVVKKNPEQFGLTADDIKGISSESKKPEEKKKEEKKD